MDEEGKYTWETNPGKWLEQNINETLIARAVPVETMAKSRKIALLNELSQLAQEHRPAIRYLVLVLDLSWASNRIDFPLSRRETILKHLESFIKNYFEDNPLSQLAVVGTTDATAHVVADFSSSAKDIVPRGIAHVVDRQSPCEDGDQRPRLAAECPQGSACLQNNVARTEAV